MPTLKIDVDGLDTAATGLRKFAAGVEDWRPYWRLLGETLATEAGSRWPLRRRSGRLRKSLTWRGDTLGPRGIFESSPDALRFGSSVFYARFFQHGTRKQRKTPLVHVDPKQHTELLRTWLRSRAVAAGVEVDR